LIDHAEVIFLRLRLQIDDPDIVARFPASGSDQLETERFKRA
jgi:hypothetical protein